LNATCIAYREETQPLYPARKPSRTIPAREAYWLIIRDPSGLVYLEQRPDRGIWGGLLSPPEFETKEALERFCTEHFGGWQPNRLMSQRRHTFSHFHLDFFPVLRDIEGPLKIRLLATGQFHDPNLEARLPTPVRKILRELPPQT
jgi:A/G-specific adenine glycosylase